MTLIPGYLSNVGKHEGRLKGGQGSLLRDGGPEEAPLENQAKVLRLIIHFHINPFLFPLFSHKIHILIALELIEAISTAERLNYSPVLFLFQTELK